MQNLYFRSISTSINTHLNVMIKINVVRIAVGKDLVVGVNDLYYALYLNSRHGIDVNKERSLNFRKYIIIH